MKNHSYGYNIQNSRKIKDFINDKLIDVTITSPPYWKMKNYNVENQIGHGQEYCDYLQDLTKVFKDIYDTTKDTGSLWVIVDTFKEKGKMKLLPFDIVRELENSKIFNVKNRWKLQDIIIWEKDKTLPWSRKGQLRNQFEYILFFVKSNNYKYNIDRIKIPDENKLKSWWVRYPERYNPHGKVPENIWRFKIPTQGSFGNGNFRHFCPFPSELIEQILLLTTNKGDTVLDPFAGSGVVLAQADCMKRKYIGFDLNEEYKRMFENHVLKDVHESWKEREKKLGLLTQRRYSLAKKIKNLRQIKYPKSLIREIAKGTIKGEYENFPIDDLNSIFAISRNSNGNNSNDKFKFMEEDICLIFESMVNENLLLEIVNEICEKYPLSKFGIKPTFYFFTINDFIREQEQNNLINEKKLWLYSRGLVNKYDKPITLDEWKTICYDDSWKNDFKNKLPPIISNIRVNIDYKSPSNILEKNKM